MATIDSSSVATHSTTIDAPMIENIAESNGVWTLKWLRLPRTTCNTMIAYSATSTRVTVHADAVTTLDRLGSKEITHAQAIEYNAIDTANLNGFSQIGAPVRPRAASTIPIALPSAATSITPVMTIKGRFQPV